MKLIAEKLGKTDKYDRLRFVRGDGSESRISMPRQGTLPHDLVHYVVESVLPLKHGFLGLVADGADASFAMDMVHDRSNPAIEAESVQAEAIVEALQTQLWTDTFKIDDFLEGVATASAARGKVPFDFSGIDPRVCLYDSALALLEKWKAIPFHRSLELTFVPGRAA